LLVRVVQLALYRDKVEEAVVMAAKLKTKRKPGNQVRAATSAPSTPEARHSDDHFGVSFMTVPSPALVQ
jgi:hypothetical protein